LQIKIPVLTAIIVLTSVLAIPLTTHTAQAIPGNFVDSPANVWAPFGNVGVQNLILKYYSDQGSEFNDFVAGQLDLTDWTQPAGSFGTYDSNPDFTLSPTQGEFGIFGMYFNGASSTWGAWLSAVPANTCTSWSAAVGHNYDSQCGIDMRQAFNHLVNRADFAHHNVANPSVGLADDSPQKGGPSSSPWATQCNWDQSVMVKYQTHCYAQPASPGNCGGADSAFPWSCASTKAAEPGAYAITGSGTCTAGTAPAGAPANPAGNLLYSNCIAGQGFPAMGSPDFCAAAEHMLAAGIGSGLNPTTCVLTFSTAQANAILAHPLRFMRRSTNPRKTLGLGFENGLIALFGLGNGILTDTVGGITQLGPIVFDNQVGATDDWDMYTYGYSEGGPFSGDALVGLYSSQFASPNGVLGGQQVCAGAAGVQHNTPNPTYVCDATLDGLLKTQSNSANLASYSTNTLAVFNRMGAIADDMGLYSPGLRIAALTSVAGLVNVRGFGYNSAQDIINAHQGSAPVNPIFAFGGGNANTFRYGQASPTTSLNMYTASTVWEFQTLGQVYDTLFTGNPVDGTQVFCWMCNSGVVSTVDSSGNTHFRIELKQNLRFHDGSTVTAQDVAFSLLSLRDLAPTAGGALSSLLKSVQVFSSTTLDVVFYGQSLLYPPSMEAFVVPQSTYACNNSYQANDCALGLADVNAACADPVSAANCAANYAAAGVSVPSDFRAGPNTTFDPVASNALIGSGPYVCMSVFQPGIVGGGCVQNADSSQGGMAIPPGGRMLLQAFDFTSQAGNTDPLKQYMRGSNSAWGTGSGTAAESGQLQEFLYADHSGDGVVDAVDLGTIAACIGVGPAGSGSCPAATYTYFHRAAFDSGTISSQEVNIVASHYDDTYVAPFQWNAASITNVVPYP
jgi:hypothetical protein